MSKEYTIVINYNCWVSENTDVWGYDFDKKDYVNA